GEARRLQLSRILDVRGEKQIERRAILYLREEISTRAVRHIHFRFCLLLKLSCEILHGELQVRGCRDANRLPLGSHSALRKKYGNQQWGNAERLKPVCFFTSHRSPITSRGSSHTLRIITSVDLIRAAARSPGFSRISLAASAVMIAVMCCSPIAIVTCASNPLYFSEITRPINWLRPLIFRKLPRRIAMSPRSSFLGIIRSISLSGTR